MVVAEVYITAEEAIKKIFPDTKRHDIKNQIQEGQIFKVYTVYKNDEVLGWAVVSDEMGKVKPITFLVAIGKERKVLAVYILEYRDLFGSDIKRKSFLKQFRGKSSKDLLKVGRDIDAVTSATISSNAAATAVKKALKITEGL
jgi:Na+-translocating ferredoxin:NAD+ oxidoreductase RnfG subunit